LDTKTNVSKFNNETHMAHLFSLFATNKAPANPLRYFIDDKTWKD